jgi:hypothetical protein
MSLTCREGRIGGELLEEWRVDGETLATARDGRRQVEAESVDMHFRHPVAQAVEHEAMHQRMPHVEGIAAAGEVS